MSLLWRDSSYSVESRCQGEAFAVTEMSLRDRAKSSSRKTNSRAKGRRNKFNKKLKKRKEMTQSVEEKKCVKRLRRDGFQIFLFFKTVLGVAHRGQCSSLPS